MVIAAPSLVARTRGFSLWELMVTLAVFAVIVGIGVPGFTSFIANQRVRSASFDLNSSLLEARSEATRRNIDVVVSQANGGWQNGWTVTAGGATLRQREALPNLNITATQTTITFQGNGRLPAGAAQVQFTIAPGTSTAGVSSRCLNVDTGGKTNTDCG